MGIIESSSPFPTPPSLVGFPRGSPPTSTRHLWSSNNQQSGVHVDCVVFCLVGRDTGIKSGVGRVVYLSRLSNFSSLAAGAASDLRAEGSGRENYQGSGIEEAKDESGAHRIFDVAIRRFPVEA
jgi:hypothetical protein